MAEPAKKKPRTTYPTARQDKAATKGAQIHKKGGRRAIGSGKKESSAGKPANAEVVRFTDEQKVGLDEIQERLGLSKASLVRWAVDGLIAKYERDGKRLVLPIRFEEDDIAQLREAEGDSPSPPKQD